MKTMILKALAFAGVAAAGTLTSAPAFAQSATGDATVTVLQALSVTKTADLNFGKITASNTASTVAVAQDGTRTCGTGLTCYGTTTAGAFNVLGSAGESVSVVLDNPTITLANGASDTMSVALTASASSLTLTGGAGSFRVAGVLNVGAFQAQGTYTGQYSVSVNYQ
ncbi:DUF4402 domain-containing protein [Sphingomonas changnyeongensis]|uniref:DUF4402 domain-containing protein n=1 Tax=Sphingomonas changnyeongensis TaxID=2698679 RepID=A0A7Z2S778_9SPHN|nr:DUF4402 domain-containing protein [Sphingomonas changnyeongensis]QHL90106.1 DUF4402 domain-containing protein [Sphingomonas changnyeongensis]